MGRSLMNLQSLGRSLGYTFNEINAEIPSVVQVQVSPEMGEVYQVCWVRVSRGEGNVMAVGKNIT